jgi:hypothetical protein
MEAAFTKFRMAIAIMATIVMGAASFQAIGAAGDPPQMPGSNCPPQC